jgi:hypothetical protein
VPLNPPESDPLPESAPVAWRALIVAGSTRRHQQIQDALAAQQPTGRVEVADTVVDALLRMTHRPFDLLLLDLAVDDAFAPVVVRHLARVSPRTTVMVFDDVVRTVPGHLPVREWAALGDAVRLWLQERVCRQPTGPGDAASLTHNPT